MARREGRLSSAINYIWISQKETSIKDEPVHFPSVFPLQLGGCVLSDDLFTDKCICDSCTHTHTHTHTHIYIMSDTASTHLYLAANNMKLKVFRMLLVSWLTRTESDLSRDKTKLFLLLCTACIIRWLNNDRDILQNKYVSDFRR